MKNLKQSIAFILAMIMTLSMTPLSALAQEVNIKTDASGTNKYCSWSYDAGSDTLYVNQDGVLESVQIEYLDSETNEPCTDSFAPLFYDDTSYDFDNMWQGSFTNLVVGKDVTRLYAQFGHNEEHSKLRNVSFEQGSKTSIIGEYCLAYTDLESIELTERISTLKQYAFAYTQLKSIYIPQSISTLNGNVFKGCERLKNVEFQERDSDYLYTNADGIQTTPGKITEMPTGIFEGCTSLESVIMPDSIAVIGESAFKNCKSLQSINITDKIKNIRSYAFFGCTSLKEFDFTLLGSYARLWEYSFAGTGLESINLSNRVSVVDQYAFAETNLYEAVLGSSLSAVDNYTFKNSTIKNLIVNVGDSVLASNAFNGAKINTIDMSQSAMTSIVSSLFKGITTLTEVLLPPNLTKISESSFQNCKSLEKVNFNSNLTSIGSNAFSNTGIKEVDLSGTNISVIDSYAFTSCNNLENVYLNSGITDIKLYAFSSCKNLSNIDFNNAPLTIGNYAFYCDTALTAVDLGSNTKSIGQYCFKGCTALETVNVSESLTGMGQYSFENCSSLKTVTGCINIISKGAFKACSNLESVAFGTDCKTINSEAFSNCISLDCPLPSQLTTVDKNAFYNCKSLNRILPATVETVGENAFKYSGITFSNAILTSIGNYAFSACPRLTNITISGDLTVIQKQAFSYCENLTSVSLMGSNINYISERAFSGCINLKTINIAPTLPLKSIGLYAFDGTAIEEFTIPETVENVYAGIFSSCNSLSKIVVNSQIAKLADSSLGTYNDSNRIIYGYKNSTAETYAITNHMNFVALDGEGVSYARNGTWGTNGKWSIDLINIDSKTKAWRLTISGSGDMPSNIVKSANGDNVNLAETCCYYKVEQVVIGDGVTSVPDRLLYLSEDSPLSVTSITLPSTLKRIGNYAFTGCKDIKKIILSEGLISIGDYAFSGCAIEARLLLPSTVTTLGEGAFSGCDNLSMIIVGDACTSIYYNSVNRLSCSFGGKSDGTLNQTFVVKCSRDSEAYNYAVKMGLKIICIDDMPNEIGTVGTCEWEYHSNDKVMYVVGAGTAAGAFKYDDGTKVNVGEMAVDKIVYCEGITSIENNSSISTNNGKLRGKGNICVLNPAEVELPSTLQCIGTYAFMECSRLEYINIPESVNRIKEYAFTASGLKYFTAPSSLNIIYDCAFEGCKSLKGVELSNTVSVCKYAFADCGNLVYLDLGVVEEIGPHAFANAVKLPEIIIPDTTTTINNGAFEGGVMVKKLVLGTGLTEIEGNAFSNLIYLNQLDYNSISIENISGGVTMNNAGIYTKGFQVNVGDAVESFDMYLLSMSNATKINFGKNVQSILTGDYIPSPLISITVDEENPYIYSYENCAYNDNDELVISAYGLKSITIKDSTTAICSNAFNTSRITSIVIPDSVTEIYEYAFAYCEDLKSVSFSNNITNIRNGAFKQCTRLKTIDLPEHLVEIGESAFRECTSLASVIMNYELKEIQRRAFYGCSSLSGLVIGENVEYIAPRAFATCGNLEYVYMFNTSFENNTFYNSNNAVIYTMAGSVSYEDARLYDVPYVAYTDLDKFYDDVAAKLDILAGYLGYCVNGHGDIEWLTVYEADCSNDGYMIGVCEYCSEILDERHIDACGHNYQLTAHIDATESTKGVDLYTCTRCCATYTEYTQPTSLDYVVETHTVTAKVVIAQNITASKGVTPVRGAQISIAGEVIAETDTDGCFTLSLETGTYEATISYTYGFDRKIFIIVEDSDIEYGSIPIIGCDWNSDGIINDDDMHIFRLTISSEAEDASYLNFVDMDNNGYINAKDYAYIRLFNGFDNAKYQYVTVVIKK